MTDGTNEHTEPGCLSSWFDGLAHRLAYGMPAKDSECRPHTVLEGESMGPYPMHVQQAIDVPDYQFGQVYDDEDDD